MSGCQQHRHRIRLLDSHPNTAVSTVLIQRWPMTNIATRNRSSGLGIAHSTFLVLAMRNSLCMCPDALRGRCLRKRRARKSLSISVSQTLPNGDPACYILIPPRERRLLIASSCVSDILLISYPEAFIKRHVLAKDTHRRYIVRMHSRQQLPFNIYRSPSKIPMLKHRYAID